MPMMTFKIAFDRRLEANISKPFELVTDNRSVRRAEVAMLLHLWALKAMTDARV